MKNGSACEMCGQQLHSFSKSYLCSAKCRKAKSRLKVDAGRNMIAARNSIRSVIKGLELDVISSIDSYDEYEDLKMMLGKLADAHNARYQREIAEDERRRAGK